MIAHDDILAAAARIAPYALRTPVKSSAALDALSGASLFFKCENLQIGGAFKFRGAINAVFALDEAVAARGVITHSSGNHGAALARAAKLRGIAAHVVVPEGAVPAKLEAMLAAGAIADAAGVRAALALGAAGVQVGTAFLCCPEARTSAVHRAALAGVLPGVETDTAVTAAFTGRPARALVNRWVRESATVQAQLPPFPLAAGALAGLRQAAEAAGRGDFSPLWAGQNTRACRTVPAAEVVRELAGGLNPNSTSRSLEPRP